MPQITQKLGFDARNAISNVGKFADGLDKGTAALARFQAQAGKGGNWQKLMGNIDKTRKGAAGLVVGWKTLARIISTQFVVRGLASLLGAIKENIGAARELGLAIEEIQTIAGRKVSSSQLFGDITAISNEIGKSSQDIAEAYYQTLSNQVVDVGDALNFTSEAAKLATITASETKDAVNALSSVMNSYGYGAERANYVAGTLFKTVEYGRLRLSEIANVIGRVTPLTAQMGVEWEEAAASIAVMTRQGVRADTAITQLRAVMTKMIKPTDDVREIFRRWGVQDGKQAIETFGGLGGVLKKLNDEVGGSSAEMAELLRNVRAIVGEMGMMTNEGKELEETLAKIKESTGELNAQWDLFAASDAHRLTVEMNEFKNTLITIGADNLPTILAGMKWLNEYVSNLAMGIRVMSGEFDEAGIHAELMKRMALKAGKEINDRNKKFDEEQRKRYENLAGAASRYYADVQREEFKLEDVRNASIEAATKAVQKQGTKIANFYKDAASNLKKFVDEINDKIKDNTEEIADIDREISDRKLQQELDKWDDVYQKRRILEEALQEQRQKASEAYGDVDATEESRDRALKENQIAIDMAEQSKQLAEQTGHRKTINDAEDSIQGLLENRKKIYEEHTKQLEASKGKLSEISDQMQKDESELQALIKERNDLYDSGALDDENETRRKNAEEILESLNKKIDKIVAGAGRHDAFLKSLGLEESMMEVSAGITEALNDAHKDWQEEVRLAKEAFKGAQIELKAKIDSDGSLGPAAEATGVDLSTKGAAEGARMVDEAAVKQLQEYESKQNQIANLQSHINGMLADTNIWLNRAGQQTVEELKSTQAVSDMRVNVRNSISAITFGLVGAVDANERFNQAMRTSHGLAYDVNVALREGVQSIKDKTALTDDEIAGLRTKIATALEAKQIDEGQARSYGNVVDSIEKANAKLREQNAIKDSQPAEADVQAMQQRVEYLEQAKQKQEAEKQAAEGTRQATEAAKGATQGHAQAIQQGVQAQNQQTQAANETVGSTSQIGPTAAAQAGAVAALTQHYIQLAQAAREAAAAQAAAAGGGAVAYHGGPMARYFASGGLVTRGQDKILTALSAGETVVNSKNSKRFFSELNAMNQGSQPVFREQGGPVTNVGDINVSVNGGDSSQQTVREIAHALRREVQRGNIKLR